MGLISLIEATQPSALIHDGDNWDFDLKLLSTQTLMNLQRYVEDCQSSNTGTIDDNEDDTASNDDEYNDSAKDNADASDDEYVPKSRKSKRRKINPKDSAIFLLSATAAGLI